MNQPAPDKDSASPDASMRVLGPRGQGPVGQLGNLQLLAFDLRSARPVSARIHRDAEATDPLDKLVQSLQNAGQECSLTTISMISKAQATS